MQGEVEKQQIDSVAFPIDAFEFNRETGMLYLKDGWDLNIDDNLNVGLDLEVSQTISGGAFKGGSVEVDEDDYTVTDTDGSVSIEVDTGSSDRTITLPTAADNTARILVITKVNSGSGIVVVDGEGAETINGAATLNLVSQYDGVVLLATGSGWRPWIILSLRASYDTGWINRSDWTNVHLGSDDTLNADSNVTHNLDAPLSELVVKVLVSTDGTDANSFEIGYTDYAPSAATRQYNYQVYAVDDDNVRVQTGAEGLMQFKDADGLALYIDTENWYYKIKVWKLG